MRTVDLAGFNAAIDRFATKDLPEFVAEATRTAALYTWNLLQEPRREPGAAVFGSPVLSGRYRASIRVSVNEIDFSVAPRSKTPNIESIPAPSVDQARAKLVNLKMGDKVFLSDAVPYIYRIENGYSKKTPQGVFLTTAVTALAGLEHGGLGKMMRASISLLEGKQ